MRPGKPWLSAETFAVIELKADAKKKNDHVERKRLQSIFRVDRESYLNKLAKEVEEGVLSNHLGPAFRAIRSLTGSRSPQVTPVINKLTGHHVIPRPSLCSAGRNTLRLH